MKKYEYRYYEFSDAQDDADFLQQLNSLGAQGWTVVVANDNAEALLLMRETPIEIQVGVRR